MGDLSGCSNLQNVDLSWNSPIDLGPLQSLRQLEVLAIQDNYLDLTPGSLAMLEIQAIQRNNPGIRGSMFSYTPQRTLPAAQPLDVVAVPANPGVDVHLHFDGANIAGVTTATQIMVAHAAPTGFQIVNGNGGLLYYNISSTAVFTGDVYVTISLPPGTDTAPLKLEHWDSSTNGWTDITVSRGTNTITGKTTSFSDFAVMAPTTNTPAASVWSLVLLAIGLLGVAEIVRRQARAVRSS